MDNELKILPLREYEVEVFGRKEPDVFTADTMLTDKGSVMFYRTGNIVRGYYNGVVTKVVVTPADE